MTTKETKMTVAPLMDLFEADDAFLLRGDLPGVDEDNLQISVEKRELVIEGSSEVAGEVHYRRSFRISEKIDVERISAELDAGVLSVRLPKIIAAQKRRIEIKSA